MVNGGCRDPEIVSTDRLPSRLQISKQHPIDQGCASIHSQNGEMADRLDECLISLVREPCSKFTQCDCRKEESVSSMRARIRVQPRLLCSGANVAGQLRTSCRTRCLPPFVPREFVLLLRLVEFMDNSVL
jgi:hypothetical protein